MTKLLPVWHGRESFAVSLFDQLPVADDIITRWYSLGLRCRPGEKHSRCFPILELFPAATGRQQLNDTRSWSGSVKHTPGGTAIVVDDCWFLCDLSTRSNALPPSFSNMRRAWQVFIQLRGVTQAWCCVLFFIIWLSIKLVRKITVSERHRWITSFLATGVDGFLSILFKFHFGSWCPSGWN